MSNSSTWKALKNITLKRPHNLPFYRKFYMDDAENLLGNPKCDTKCSLLCFLLDLFT